VLHIGANTALALLLAAIAERIVVLHVGSGVILPLDPHLVHEVMLGQIVRADRQSPYLLRFLHMHEIINVLLNLNLLLKIKKSIWLT
jgi:hypothetical protein